MLLSARVISVAACTTADVGINFNVISSLAFDFIVLKWFWETGSNGMQQWSDGNNIVSVCVCVCVCVCVRALW